MSPHLNLGTLSWTSQGLTVVGSTVNHLYLSFCECHCLELCSAVRYRYSQPMHRSLSRTLNYTPGGLGESDGKEGSKLDPVTKSRET